jgi:hypothetical protein
MRRLMIGFPGRGIIRPVSIGTAFEFAEQIGWSVAVVVVVVDLVASTRLGSVSEFLVRGCAHP